MEAGVPATAASTSCSTVMVTVPIEGAQPGTELVMVYLNTLAPITNPPVCPEGAMVAGATADHAPVSVILRVATPVVFSKGAAALEQIVFVCVDTGVAEVMSPACAMSTVETLSGHFAPAPLLTVHVKVYKVLAVKVAATALAVLALAVKVIPVEGDAVQVPTPLVTGVAPNW